MGGFWPRVYVVEKGHARDIHFLLQTRNFWHFSAPSSLFTCCYLLHEIYSPVPFIGCIGSSHMKLRSDRSADLNALGPVPGVDVMAKRSQGWVKSEDRLPYYRNQK